MDRRVRVDSAATHGYHTGEPPDPRSVAAARTRGIMMGDLRARPLVRGDGDEFDLILAMDRGHLLHIQNMMSSGQKARTGLFLDFAPEQALREVPDPYYGGARDFERVLDLVEAGVAGLMAHLRSFDDRAESV